MNERNILKKHMDIQSTYRTWFFDLLEKRNEKLTNPLYGNNHWYQIVISHRDLLPRGARRLWEALNNGSVDVLFCCPNLIPKFSNANTKLLQWSLQSCS